ncbi:T9SS type A sorting domain-containing protein [Flavobacterium sp. CYK-4]|uniref:T9SS type A sorting domain-containing protein n=1 Tax=Flavobacterium lotistagni TaxID=2709660 RepID=UPI00140848C3|nr:T9SS type A sorting domain-containing protein [Flavobacterium lotistagni]NHM07574.1 T9SS type A sorting domain-containing protein [Flavobacterium lotistagni]
MKRLLPLILLLFSQYLMAQLEIVGSKSYGQLLFMEYDPLVPNKIYAATVRNHIVMSEDNGLNWSVFYTVPTVDFKQINSLKIYNSTMLSFTLQDGYSNCNKIYMLDISSRQITDEYLVPIPINSDESAITAYDFYNNEILIAQQIYGISGSRYAKVYYTINGGTTWTTVYHNIDYDSIFPNDVAIAPNDPDKLFIARVGGLDPEDYGGLFISKDAGETWEEKLSGIELGSITFHPNTPNDILIGSWYGTITHLFRSSDSGENWEDVFPELPNEMNSGILDIQYNPANYLNIVALGLNEIMRTQDGFQTKEIIHYENNMENPNNYYFGSKVTFNPFQTNELLITNNDYPLRSTNGGETVQKIDNRFFFSQNGQLNFYEKDNEKHLYYSVQNGFVHRNLNTNTETPHGIQPLQSLPNVVSQFYADANQLGRVYAANQSFFGSGIGLSNDHGNNIQGFATSNVYFHALASKPSNPNILFCSVSNDFQIGSLIQFDVTDLNNVQQAQIDMPASGLIQAFHFDATDSSRLRIALNNRLYLTTNYGVNWDVVTSGLENLNNGETIFHMDQNPLHPDQLTLATSQGIFTSTDHGNQWVQLSSFDAHEVHHSDSNANYLVAITYDTQTTDFALRYSVDSGETWQQITTEELLYLYSGTKNVQIDFKDSTAEVYIGTYDLGVIKYTIDFNQLSNPVFQSGKKYRIFPNPTGSLLYVNALNNEEALDFSIYDMTGKAFKVLSKNETIDLNGLENGSYFLKIQSKEGNQEVHRIIKK